MEEKKTLLKSKTISRWLWRKKKEKKKETDKGKVTTLGFI